MTTETKRATLAVVFPRPSIARAWARAWARTMARMVTRDNTLNVDEYLSKIPQDAASSTVSVMQYVVQSILHRSTPDSHAEREAIAKWNRRAEHWATPAWWVMATVHAEAPITLTVSSGEEGTPKVGERTLLIPVFATAINNAKEKATAEERAKAEERLKERTEIPQRYIEMSPALGMGYGVDSSHDDVMDAAKYGSIAKAWHNQYNEVAETRDQSDNFKHKETTMKFKSQQASNSILKSLKFTATHQGGNAGLAALKSLTLKLLPIKWGFWARLTGKHKAVCNHPLTTLAVATGLNLVAQHALKEDNPTLVATQALQDAAMADAIANYGELQNVVNKLLDPESVNAPENNK